MNGENQPLDLYWCVAQICAVLPSLSSNSIIGFRRYSYIIYTEKIEFFCQLTITRHKGLILALLRNSKLTYQPT